MTVWIAGNLAFDSETSKVEMISHENRKHDISLLSSFISKLKLTNGLSSSNNTTGIFSVMEGTINLVKNSSGNVVSSSHFAILTSVHSTTIIDEAG